MHTTILTGTHREAIKVQRAMGNRTSALLDGDYWPLEPQAIKLRV